jgi:hypothetical protein
MAIPTDFMIINELVISLLVQWKHIKDLVALAVSKVEGLLHFENINFKVGQITYINIILQRRMFILALPLRNILYFFKIDVMLILYPG